MEQDINLPPEILAYAARYAIGRPTMDCKPITHQIRRHWFNLSKTQQTEIITDIEFEYRVHSQATPADDDFNSSNRWLKIAWPYWSKLYQWIGNHGLKR